MYQLVDASRTLPRSKWMLPPTMCTEAGVPAQVVQTLEDTPFYGRTLLSSGLLGERIVSSNALFASPQGTPNTAPFARGLAIAGA